MSNKGIVTDRNIFISQANLPEKLAPLIWSAFVVKAGRDSLDMSEVLPVSCEGFSVSTDEPFAVRGSPPCGCAVAPVLPERPASDVQRTFNGQGGAFRRRLPARLVPRITWKG
jgi:hypothetical protein